MQAMLPAGLPFSQLNSILELKKVHGVIDVLHHHLTPTKGRWNLLTKENILSGVNIPRDRDIASEEKIFGLKIFH